MRKLAVLLMAFILILSVCSVKASATEYGRDPKCDDLTAQGEYIYYISDNKICRMHITDGKQKTVCEVIGEEPNSLCVMGNYLYYYSSYETDDFDSVDPCDAVYKVDIGSGKQTKIFDCAGKDDEHYVYGIITSGDRLYIQIYRFVHEEVPGIYNVNICDTDGECLKIFTPCSDEGCDFIDAESCDVCAASAERKTVYTYDEDGDPDDWSLEYTGAYNIVKIKSDLSEERITVSEKVGKNLKKIVYCGEKYIYYIDNEDRLCRYNTETEKYAVLADGDVSAAYYKGGAVYFLTNGGELKKYKKSQISTLDENVSAAYFFNEYILYYGENASLENDIPKVISFKTTG